MARRLGIHEVRIPFAAGVLSALGCLTSSVSFDFVFGYMRELDDVDWNYIDQRYEDLLHQGRQQLSAAAITEGITTTLSVDMRYYGQRYEVNVPLPQLPLARAPVAAIQDAFIAAYRGYYGREIADVPSETVSWRLNVSGPRPELDIAWPGRDKTADEVRPKSARDIVFPGSDSPLTCEIYERSDLPVGTSMSGPVIVEDIESTTVVPQDAKLTVDEERMLVLELARGTL